MLSSASVSPTEIPSLRISLISSSNNFTLRVCRRQRFHMGARATLSPGRAAARYRVPSRSQSCRTVRSGAVQIGVVMRAPARHIGDASTQDGASSYRRTQSAYVDCRSSRADRKETTRAPGQRRLRTFRTGSPPSCDFRVVALPGTRPRGTSGRRGSLHTQSLVTFDLHSCGNSSSTRATLIR